MPNSTRLSIEKLLTLQANCLHIQFVTTRSGAWFKNCLEKELCYSQVPVCGEALKSFLISSPKIGKELSQSGPPRNEGTLTVCYSFAAGCGRAGFLDAQDTSRSFWLVCRSVLCIPCGSELPTPPIVDLETGLCILACASQDPATCCIITAPVLNLV